jgi:hypothetical protein
VVQRWREFSMHILARCRTLAAAAAAGVSVLPMLLASGPPLAAAGGGQRAFVREWQGRTVIVRQTLFALVYNERGRLGKTYPARREGVTVVTPDDGVYFQFDGRQHRQDVVVRAAHLLSEAVAREYEGDPLDVRTYTRLEPIALMQHDPGHTLIVAKVEVLRDTVRLAFALPAAPNEPVSWLKAKWPLPFGKDFAERELVEQLVRRFVDVVPLR